MGLWICSAAHHSLAGRSDKFVVVWVVVHEAQSSELLIDPIAQPQLRPIAAVRDLSLRTKERRTGQCNVADDEASAHVVVSAHRIGAALEQALDVGCSEVERLLHRRVVIGPLVEVRHQKRLPARLREHKRVLHGVDGPIVERRVDRRRVRVVRDERRLALLCAGQAQRNDDEAESVHCPT